MAKSQYEGYCEGTSTKLVREEFGDIKVYTQNAKLLLNKATGFIAAYDFTLNPYRGCQYGCSYCYAAAFSPDTNMRQDWGKWVIIKENAAKILEKELDNWRKKNPHQPPTIYMSSVTDPYQPIESKYQLTRRLLEVMLDYRPTLVIQTRSPIITRDIDILQRFQRLRLQEIQKSGARFSWLEKLFRDKLQLERYSQQYKQEAATLSSKLNKVFQQQENRDPVFLDYFKLAHNQEFIDFVHEHFKLIEHDENKFQCTGTDKRIFDDFEAKLVEYLREEFTKIPDEQLVVKLQDALEDINSLKNGKDPEYGFRLTPHVYFMKYFLENVYCVYLAWFLIYQADLLPTKVNILDIAAGPGTVAYGLALFLQSFSGFLSMLQMDIFYYSLEKQDAFQFRGLQFWRRYIESRKTPVNAYFRFVTTDLLTWNNQSSNIPKDFFDFIVVSHCFFSDAEKRFQANNTYKQIFASCLKKQGYVLLIVQDKKLFKIYDTYQVENPENEKKVVSTLVADLGLELVWYKYLTSTALRTPFGGAEFAKFAREQLPKQLYMSPMVQKYFGQKYESNYTFDDYVILAKTSEELIYEQTTY